MGIPFSRTILQNGLHVIVHEDHTTPLAACTLVYRVGARDEDAEHTGLAHLCEHLMFTGSQNAPDFDVVLQKAGGINNAYTSQDLTNYYIVLPAQNIETALWLESDRLASLNLSENSINIQKHVVIEEFKETSLNVPYGDLLMQLYALSYKKHPYQWLPIGKCVEQIETVSNQTVRDFFKRFYCPANAILVVAGNVKPQEVYYMAEKWFGDIPPGERNKHSYPEEPAKESDTLLELAKDVPSDMLYKSWPMCERTDRDYYTYDLFSDILGTGKSSYLYKKFVIEERLFADISASVSGTAGKGLFLIGGRPASGVSIEQADEAVYNYLKNLSFNNLEYNLKKVQNNAESIVLERNLKVEDRANTLATGEFYSCAEDFADETAHYMDVTTDDILSISEILFKNSHCNTLYYKSE